MHDLCVHLSYKLTGTGWGEGDRSARRNRGSILSTDSHRASLAACPGGMIGRGHVLRGGGRGRHVSAVPGLWWEGEQAGDARDRRRMRRTAISLPATQDGRSGSHSCFDVSGIVSGAVSGAVSGIVSSHDPPIVPNGPG